MHIVKACLGSQETKRGISVGSRMGTYCSWNTGVPVHNADSCNLTYTFVWLHFQFGNYSNRCAGGAQSKELVHTATMSLTLKLN